MHKRNDAGDIHDCWEGRWSCAQRSYSWQIFFDDNTNVESGDFAEIVSDFPVLQNEAS